MSVEVPTYYDEIWEQAKQAGDEGLHLNFSSRQRLNEVRRKLLTARNNRRREYKRLFPTSHELWGRSGWDHLDFFTEGDTGLWIVPSAVALRDVRVVEKDK